MTGVLFEHTVDASNKMFQITYQEIPCIQPGIFLGAPGTELCLARDETEDSDMVKFG